ncbi:MAG: 30S ribosomal protein S7 [Bdellovibrionales bacterium]
MSRRRGNYKREVLPDPKFNDTLVTKFCNGLMLDGKKSAAQTILYSAMDELNQKVGGEDALSAFKKAIDNVKPSLEVRSRRVGGSVYQVPVDVRPVRRTTLAIRWLVEFSRKRGEKDMSARLANELIEAFNNRGNAVKKKEETHRMADANKAFAHYRW